MKERRIELATALLSQVEISEASMRLAIFAGLTFLLVSTTAPVLYARERILLRIGPSGSRLFIAKTDGSDERPVLPNSGFDYNASLLR
jgi:hypothetical protein